MWSCIFKLATSLQANIPHSFDIFYLMYNERENFGYVTLNKIMTKAFKINFNPKMPEEFKINSPL